MMPRTIACSSPASCGPNYLRSSWCPARSITSLSRLFPEHLNFLWRTPMKGNDKIIATLNELLADELTAISQYMVHSEMCDNWGYDKLHKAIEAQAVDEMHHAEWLIARLIFLEGMHVVSKLNPMKIGAKGADMVVYDEEAELGA